LENLVTFTSKLVQKQNENIAPEKAFFITLDPGVQTLDPGVQKRELVAVSKANGLTIEKAKIRYPFAEMESKELITDSRSKLNIKPECNRFKVVYGYPYDSQTQDNQASNKINIQKYIVHPDSVIRGLMRAAKFIQIPEKDKYTRAQTC